MTHPVLRLAALLLAASAFAQGTRATPAEGKPLPDFAFPTFQYGDGRQRLSDFFGQPILIEFWGVH